MTRSDAQKVFNEAYGNDKTISALNSKLAAGKGTLVDAQTYSNKIADLASNVLQKYCDMSGMAIEELEDVATSVLRPVLRQAQSYVAKYTQDVETLNNSRAGLSLRGVAPTLEQSRADNMIQRILEKPSESQFLLEKPALRNQMGEVVRSGMRANNQLRYDAGLVVKVSRSMGDDCCKWCEDLCGIHDYGKEPDDFYRAHRNCTCVWSTFTEKNGRRNELSKQWFKVDEAGNLKRKRSGDDDE